VGLDRQIYTVDPDGSNLERITPESGVYTWPAWSPDADRIVYSDVLEEDQGNFTMSLFAFDVVSGASTEIYAGEPGVTGLLAEGVAHYPLWAPDSKRGLRLSPSPRRACRCSSAT